MSDLQYNKLHERTSKVRIGEDLDIDKGKEEPEAGDFESDEEVDDTKKSDLSIKDSIGLETLKGEVTDMQERQKKIIAQLTPIKVAIRKFIISNMDVLKNYVKDTSGPELYQLRGAIYQLSSSGKRRYFGADLKLNHIAKLLDELLEIPGLR